MSEKRGPEVERLLDRLFPPGQPEKHVKNFAIFPGERAHEVGPEGLAAEINKAMDAFERGDFEVVEDFPDEG